MITLREFDSKSLDYGTEMNASVSVDVVDLLQ
jgi:hypothetical protein